MNDINEEIEFFESADDAVVHYDEDDEAREDFADEEISTDVSSGENKLSADDGGVLEQAQDDDKPANSDDAPKKPFADILDWTSCFVYAIAAVLALNLFFFRSITVSGESMNDTLLNNDMIIASNFMYTPKHGDIVIIEADKLHLNGTVLYGETIIKRVIAVEGEKIRIDFENGIVYLNGEALEEDYIKEPIRDHHQGWIENNVEYEVPKHCVFVMGDNRNRSNDSRNMNEVGFIDTNYIMGKAIVRYAPFSSFKWLG